MQYYSYYRLRSKDRDPLRHKKPCPPDFTIISCTLGTEQDYASNVRSWLACQPSEFIISTIDESLPRIGRLADSLADCRVRILSARSPDWRKQACEAIRNVSAPYLVFVDDRVRWGPHMLQHLAIAFEDPAVGGVTPMAQVVPRGRHLTTWESCGALNVVRRNILHSSLAYFMDGEVLNLAGRTSGYRTSLFQQENFYQAFQQDYWRGRYLLRTGDDNFLTSWVMRRGWKTQFMNHKEAAILAKVNADTSYLKQLIRWSRDTARCYLRDSGFAIKTRKSSILIHCTSKVIANYASDFALIMEIGTLLLITTLRTCCDDALIGPFQM